MYIYIYIYMCEYHMFQHKISKDIGSFAGPQITPIHCTSEGERVVVKDPRVQYEIYMGRTFLEVRCLKMRSAGLTNLRGLRHSHSHEPGKAPHDARRPTRDMDVAED